MKLFSTSQHCHWKGCTCNIVFVLQATLLLLILCHVLIYRSGEFVKVTFTTNPFLITMLSLCCTILFVHHKSFGEQDNNALSLCCTFLFGPLRVVTDLALATFYRLGI